MIVAVLLAVQVVVLGAIWFELRMMRVLVALDGETGNEAPGDTYPTL